MNTEEKLLKLRKLADAMYYAAQNLTTNPSWLYKAMDEYHKFIINEYHKEETTTSVWHDKSEKPKMNSIIVMNNDQTTLSVEYVGQLLCGVERWAYLDNLLKL